MKTLRLPLALLLYFLTLFLLPSASAAGDGSPPYWLRATSDGGPAIGCNASGVASGFSCKGSYCDDVNLLCTHSGYSSAGSAWSGYVSDEAPSETICPNNGFVSGVRCTGSYCDNVSVNCTTLNNGGVRKNCFWTAPVSEESIGRFVSPAGMAIAGVRCSGRYCDNTQFHLCQYDAELPSADLAALAAKFAPRLRFDQEFGTGSGDQSKCFPSDPGIYYDQRRAGVSPQALCNKDYSSISSARIPTYYMARKTGVDTVVIRYWYFYAWQGTCTLTFGSHAADWESLAVVIVGGQLRRVAWFQHGGWYSREAGQYELAEGTHPVAYVGKNAHGSYHDAGGSGGCLYFEDFRNPGSRDYRMDTWRHLVALKRGSAQPAWMNCSGDGCFDGIGHPVDQTGDLLALGGCNKDGCGKSSLGAAIPFITDPTGLDIRRITAKHSGKCLDVSAASRQDGAALAQYACHTGDNQRFSAESTGDGYMRIMARHSGKCLEVSGAATGDGAAVSQYACGEGLHQRFRWIDRGAGHFALQARHSGKCLDVSGASWDNGAMLVQSSCHFGDNQLFRFGP